MCVYQIGLWPSGALSCCCFFTFFCFRSRAGSVPTPDVYDHLYVIERGRTDLHIAFDVTNPEKALKRKHDHPCCPSNRFTISCWDPIKQCNCSVNFHLWFACFVFELSYLALSCQTFSWPNWGKLDLDERTARCFISLTFSGRRIFSGRRRFEFQLCETSRWGIAGTELHADNLVCEKKMKLKFLAALL